ncbi:MAG: amidohydrolase family protein [Cyanobacteria bacterium]|nr:amidohydrolase family protein [Cyanobacteriota bacterium]
MKELSPHHIILADWVLPVDTPPVERGFIALEGAYIQAVGRQSELGQTALAKPDNLYQAPPGSILTPGFINTHAHLELTYPHAIPPDAAEGGNMGDWLYKVYQQTRQAKETPEEALQAEKHRIHRGITEMLASGTTCVNDISRSGESVSLMQQAGLRGIVSLECFHPMHSTERVPAILEQWESFQARFNRDGIILPGLSPHSPFNVSPLAWQALRQALPEVRFHTHLGESRDEQAWLCQPEKPNGITQLHERILGQAFYPYTSATSAENPPVKSLVSYLSQFHLLNEHLMIAHGVMLTPEEIGLLKRHGVTLAHCPRSNLFLHQQTLDSLHWEGFPGLGLGTDSRLSCPDLDLRHEALAAMACHQWTLETALHTLTMGGASTLGWSHSLGSLTPGKWADCVLWAPKTTNMNPHPLEMLFSEDVTAQRVWVHGKQVF